MLIRIPFRDWIKAQSAATQYPHNGLKYSHKKTFPKEINRSNNEQQTFLFVSLALLSSNILF